MRNEDAIGFMAKARGCFIGLKMSFGRKNSIVFKVQSCLAPMRLRIARHLSITKSRGGSRAHASADRSTLQSAAISAPIRLRCCNVFGIQINRVQRCFASDGKNKVNQAKRESSPVEARNNASARGFRFRNAQTKSTPRIANRNAQSSAPPISLSKFGINLPWLGSEFTIIDQFRRCDINIATSIEKFDARCELKAEIDLNLIVDSSVPADFGPAVAPLRELENS